MPEKFQCGIKRTEQGTERKKEEKKKGENEKEGESVSDQMVCLGAGVLPSLPRCWSVANNYSGAEIHYKYKCKYKYKYKYIITSQLVSS